MTAAMMHAPQRASLVKTACVLWVAGIVGAILVLPYVTELEADAIKAAALASGLRPAVLRAMQMAQTAILLATAAFAGLWAARKFGLGVPILDALLSGQSVAQRNLTRLVPAVALGLAVGLVITVLDRKVFPPLAAGHGNVVPEPAGWKGLLASFYGAIDEELLLRLGFLSRWQPSLAQPRAVDSIFRLDFSASRASCGIFDSQRFHHVNNLKSNLWASVFSPCNRVHKAEAHNGLLRGRTRPSGLFLIGYARATNSSAAP